MFEIGVEQHIIFQYEKKQQLRNRKGLANVFSTNL